MNDKSYVSLERHVCLVCCAAFDTGNLLLDKRLCASLEHYTITGWGLCQEHQRLFAEGFIALVECDPQRSRSPSAGECLKPEQACRTGRLAHMKREAFTNVFNVPVRDNQACVFVESGVIDWLQSMVEPATD
jgi:hypothetical protein